MLKSSYEKDNLSLLGFGAMRLPVLDGDSGRIDEAQVQEMVDYALSHGVNYFDTAYHYHKDQSEPAIGRALAKYPRESFRLATKYPGHQIEGEQHPAEIFEEQLARCGVDYFDFYLLHCVTERSLPAYENPDYGIMDYFAEQKRLGRIRHLGFSCHAEPETMETFLSKYAHLFEFCQIELNYLDWTLQRAKEKCEIIRRHGLKIWVMEPVRGGRLAKLPTGAMQTLEALRPGVSAPEWAFRFVQELPGVEMILSGMSNMEQLRENIQTFEARKPLNDAETAALLEVAERLKNLVPCTACRYCADGCPAELDIPALLAAYNEAAGEASPDFSRAVRAFPEGKRPENCLACGACAKVCPQNIDVPAILKSFTEKAK